MQQRDNTGFTPVGVTEASLEHLPAHALPGHQERCGRIKLKTVTACRQQQVMRCSEWRVNHNELSCSYFMVLLLPPSSFAIQRQVVYKVQLCMATSLHLPTGNTAGGEPTSSLPA